MAKLGITVSDIVNALKNQNVIAPGGQIGGPPAPPGTEFSYTVRLEWRFYEQFAVTIAVSVLFSGFNSLTLGPALSALLLLPAKEKKGLLTRFFAGFNRGFDAFTSKYVF